MRVTAPLVHGNLSIREHNLGPAGVPAYLPVPEVLTFVLVGARRLVPRDALSVAIFIATRAVTHSLGLAIDVN